MPGLQTDEYGGVGCVYDRVEGQWDRGRPMLRGSGPHRQVRGLHALLRHHPRLRIRQQGQSTGADNRSRRSD